jgi:hypothetical protein
MKLSNMPNGPQAKGLSHQPEPPQEKSVDNKLFGHKKKAEELHDVDWRYTSGEMGEVLPAPLKFQYLGQTRRLTVCSERMAKQLFQGKLAGAIGVYFNQHVISDDPPTTAHTLSWLLHRHNRTAADRKRSALLLTLWRRRRVRSSCWLMYLLLQRGSQGGRSLRSCSCSSCASDLPRRLGPCMWPLTRGRSQGDVRAAPLADEQRRLADPKYGVVFF